jgi:hypothetical protein
MANERRMNLAEQRWTPYSKPAGLLRATLGRPMGGRWTVKGTWGFWWR